MQIQANLMIKPIPSERVPSLYEKSAGYGDESIPTQSKSNQVMTSDLIAEARRPSSSINDPLAPRNYLKVAAVCHHDRRYSVRSPPTFSLRAAYSTLLLVLN